MKKRLRRAVAVLLTAVMFVCSMGMSSSADTYSANSAVTYRAYDAKTGALLRTYTLEASPYPAASEARSSQGVIGTDDREIDDASSGVVKINTVDGYCYGTGFVVDEYVIATAAHVVCGGADLSVANGRIIGSVDLYKDGASDRTITEIAEVHVPSSYNNFSGEVNDYALISISDEVEDLSDYMSFDIGVMRDEFITRSVAAEAKNERLVYTTGFPDIVNGSSNEQGNLYIGAGNILPASIDSHRQFYHTIDATSGNSGGPIYTITSYKDRTCYTVIGIVSCSANDEKNKAIRMSAELLHFYKNNSNIGY